MKAVKQSRPMKSKPTNAAAKKASNKATVPPAASAAGSLWPGLVAEVYSVKPFRFPGEPAPLPSPLSLAALGELVRDRAATIEKERFEGHAEYWAGRLAGELLDWLAGRAAEGSEYAQGELVELSCKAVDWHSWSLHQGHDVTLKRARKTPDLPGRVSLNPEVSANWQAFLEGIGQGSETPVPMKRGPDKKRSKRDVYGASHRLVANLFEYMEGYRNNGIAKHLGIPSNHPEIPEIVREILSLQPFGMKGEIWKTWHKVGLKIVKDAAGGNPAKHEAFQREPLSRLINQLPSSRQTKHPLARDLNAAWKVLAGAFAAATRASSLESGI